MSVELAGLATQQGAHRSLRAVVSEDDSGKWIRGPRDVSWSQVPVEHNHIWSQMN